MNKTAIYTAIFNNYDTLKEPLIRTVNCDYICFTDNPKLRSKIWKIVNVDLMKSSASLINRQIKILGPYNELKDYQNSLYVDGTILIKSDLSAFLSHYMSFGMVNFRHPRRDCLYREIAACIASKKGEPVLFMKQCHDYSQSNMPFGFGLSDNKIIFRDHQNQDIQQLMMLWWEHVLKYGGRDQTCLPYVLFEKGLSYRFFNEDLLNNIYFEIWPHRNEFKRRLWRNIRYSLARHHLYPKQLQSLEMKIKSGITKNNKTDTF